MEYMLEIYHWDLRDLETDVIIPALLDLLAAQGIVAESRGIFMQKASTTILHRSLAEV